MGNIKTLGICIISRIYNEIENEEFDLVSIDPRGDAEDTFAPPDNKWIGFEPEFTDEQNPAVVTILEYPKHGDLVAYKIGVVRDFVADTSVSYVPNKDFIGKDKITVRVAGSKGNALVISYFINVTPAASKRNLYESGGYKQYCPSGKLIWKISD